MIISFNSYNLKVKIQCLNLKNSTWAKIILLLNASSNDIEVKSEKIVEMPWFEFRSVIKPFAKLIKNENIKVEYDDFSKRLINNHIEDILALQNVDKKTVTEKEVNDILKKNDFQRILTKQQIRNCSKLLSLMHGANFSVPGAGKTTTLLAVHSILKNEKNVENLLVIGPRNAFISWEEEVQECYGSKSPKIIRLTGGKESISSMLRKNPKIMLITYQQLTYVLNEISSFLIQNPTHLVLDEAHRIKRGPSGAHFLAVIQLADLSSRRDILTGTPMPQSTFDLAPQFNFLWPGQDVLENTLKISDEDNRVKYLNQVVKPLYVRTTKSELGLPKPKIKIKKIELGPAQLELYNLIKSETARILSGMDKGDIKSFRKLGRSVMRLLQAASNPMLIASNNEYPEETEDILPNSRMWDILSEYSKYEKPAKIEYAINRVKEIAESGEKVVLWSFFVKNIKLLEDQLKDFGAVSIYGAIETGSEKDAETREGRIRKFHRDPDCKVLIGNPAACGE
ncbi:MAG: DEAD/DEAH box helicase, partial [Candidatus Moranbacteria bacterium]|nr:DEAD/DEAH box helicase [Candidatus Moranbacteria bacterium]